MAIRDDILTLKNKEGTLAGNKVCNFAYDDTAYNDDTTTGANGVSTYNYNNHNNIPVKDIEVLKVNPTVISKGFRSQVSTLSRMFLNHIFGRVSYNLNKTVDTFNALLTNLYNYIGQPNGLATLDNTGRLPYSQLPLSAVEYKGAWNANTNTPTLASGTGTFGDEYIVSTQGTQNLGEGSIKYKVGDRVIYNGSIWQRIPASSVRTVNNKSPDANGNVTVNASDILTPDVYGYDKTSRGKIWERDSLTQTVSFKSIRYINNLWVACSNNGLYWSTDGKAWTNQVLSVNFDNVYYADGIWVANSTSGSSGYGQGLWWSTDRVTWTQGTGIGTVDIFQYVYYANGIWVACSIGHGLWWSTDGKAWTQGTGGTSYSFNFVFNDKGIWIACSVSSQGLWWSTDGKAWTQGTGDGMIYNFKYVYYANGIWVACSSGYGLYWSTDGKAWTVGTGFTYNYGFNCVYYANGKWVAGSTNNGLWWSNNGKAWVRSISGATYTFNSVYYASGLWVAGSTNNGLWWSTDGVTWTQGTGGTTVSLNSVYYANGIWVACGNGLWYSIGSSTNNVAQILDWLLFAVDNLID